MPKKAILFGLEQNEDKYSKVIIMEFTTGEVDKRKEAKLIAT